MGRVAINLSQNQSAVKVADTEVPKTQTDTQKNEWMNAYIAAGGDFKNTNVKTGTNNKKSALIKANAAAAKQPSGSPGCTIQSCPLKGCTMDNLIVSGVHNKKRKYKVQLPAKQTQQQSGVAPKDLLQVLAGFSQDSAAEIKLQFSGTCKKGSSKCPSVNISGGTINETFTASPGQVKVLGADPSTATQMVDNLIPFSFFNKNVLMPSKAPSTTYKIKTKGCSGHKVLSAKVEAIVPVSWEGKFIWGYKQDTWKKDQLRLKKEKKANFGIELKCKYGHKQYKVDGSWDKKSKGGTIVDKVFTFAGYMLEKMEIFQKLEEKNKEKKKEMRAADRKSGTPVKLKPDMFPEFKIDILWPKFAVSGGLANVEIDNQYMVETEGTVKIEADPFLGAEVSTDILDWLAAVWPIVLKIKKKLEQGHDSKYLGGKAAMIVLLGIGCSIKGELEFKWNNQSPVNTTGVFEGRGWFKADGRIYVEGRIWRVYAGAGAFITARAADKDSDDPALIFNIKPKAVGLDIGLDGGVSFNGFVIYGAYFAHIGVKALETKDNGSKKGADGLFASKEANEVAKEEAITMKKVWEACAPFDILGRNFE